jgi:hypothetical protein
VHFTRDPIIETIITARDGHKILIRDVNHVHDEYYVDIIEVVRLGDHCYYRCQEKPKPFLVPSSHFELLEVREPRMALKTSLNVEKGIKISPQKEGAGSKDAESSELKSEKKKEKKRTKKIKEPKIEKEKEEAEEPAESVSKEAKPEVPPVEKRSLIPPPSTLISETIARYKNTSAIEELALEGGLKEPEALQEELPEEEQQPQS